MKKNTHDQLQLNYTEAKRGAYKFTEAKKFPQDENGYYIPQEYWDEYGLV